MWVNGYVIVKELRRGPVSTVYIARQEKLERTVFLKQLNPQLAGYADIRERFRREALICARLQHKNIIRIIDVQTDNDAPVIVMEYVDGYSLEAFIETFHPIPSDILLYISREILRGLSHFQEKGIIHRDIKPANLLISLDGEVKIADFGLARAEDLPALSSHGQILGTGAYMSPEQSQALEVDSRSDLFSLGVTFYELAGEHSPFSGVNIVETVQKLLSQDPEPISKTRSDLPGWYSDLVGQMMQKEPGMRPDSAAEILKMPGFERVAAGAAELSALIKSDRPAEPDLAAAVDLRKSPEQRSALFRPIVAVFFAAMLALAGYVAVSLSAPSVNEPTTANSRFFAENQIEPIDTNSLSGAARLPADTTDALSIREAPRAVNDETTPDPLTAAARQAGRQSGSRSGKSSVDSLEQSIADEPLSPTTGEPVLVSSDPGQLSILCLPWAEVFIDGRDQGTTPLFKPITLSPGTHTLELRNPKFDTYRQTVVITAGQLDSIAVHLNRLEGYIDLTISPWADVYLNGEHAGTTPLEQPIAVPPGRYICRLLNPAYQTWSDTIEVTAHKTIKIAVLLKRK